MLIKSILNVQDWTESERKFRKWNNVIIIWGYQKECSMFVCISKKGVIWGCGVKF